MFSQGLGHDIQNMKTKYLMFTSLALLLMCATNAFAQLPPEALKGLWKAQWITSPSAPQRDIVVLHFRKVFEISQVPEHFVVHVSADNQFLLSVNQHEVGRGPALSDLAHWKYETYDLATSSASRSERTSCDGLELWRFSPGLRSAIARRLYLQALRGGKRRGYG